jgi:hypothetical protein
VALRLHLLSGMKLGLGAAVTKLRPA